MVDRRRGIRGRGGSEAADSAVSAAVRPAAEARAGGGRFENTPFTVNVDL